MHKILIFIVFVHNICNISTVIFFSSQVVILLLDYYRKNTHLKMLYLYTSLYTIILSSCLTLSKYKSEQNQIFVSTLMYTLKCFINLTTHFYCEHVQQQLWLFIDFVLTRGSCGLWSFNHLQILFLLCVIIVHFSLYKCLYKCF